MPKIGRLSWLPAGGKQVRAANRPEGIRQKFLGAAVFWRSTRIADGDVGVPGAQIDDAVGADHVEWRIGTRLAPARQARHEPAAGKSIGRRHAQRRSLAVAPDR